MAPREFCEHYGIQLEPEIQGNGRYLLHVMDPNRKLFPLGRRDGNRYIHHTALDVASARAYRELMDLILKKHFT